MPIIIAAGAAVLVIALLIANSGGGDGEGDGDGGQTPAAQTPKNTPKPTPSSLGRSSAQAGKTPDRPAPELPQATLDKANGMLAEAKALYNEGVKLRNAQQVPQARAKQSEAAVKIEQITTLLDGPLTWQEEAEMDDWAQPAEYVTLARLYGKVSKLEKRVRMAGGTR